MSIISLTSPWWVTTTVIGLATGMGHIDVLVRGWKERSHGTFVCLIESGGDLEFELKRIHETTEQVERLEEVD